MLQMNTICAIFTSMHTGGNNIDTQTYVRLANTTEIHSSNSPTKWTANDNNIHNSTISILEQVAYTAENDENAEGNIAPGWSLIIVISKIVIPIVCGVGICGNILNLIILMRRVSQSLKKWSQNGSSVKRFRKKSSNFLELAFQSQLSSLHQGSQ